MICSEWQSIHSRARIGFLILDPESHTHRFHTLTSSLPQAWKFEKSHGSASKTDFNSVSPREWQYLKGMLQDLPNKINFHLFSYSNKIYQSGLIPPPSKVSKDPSRPRMTPSSTIFQAPLGGSQAVNNLQKVSANHLGRHLCWPGLRHVGFCQVHSF